MFFAGYFFGLVSAVVLSSSLRSRRHTTAWLAGFAMVAGLALRFLGLI